jgi:6-phosphogluconate dehydrogenase
MVKAGLSVDSIISQLKPYLEPGDLIIDGGNSFFQDTERRSQEMESEGFQYLGIGISGGEEGAFWGPSMTQYDARWKERSLRHSRTNFEGYCCKG